MALTEERLKEIRHGLAGKTRLLGLANSGARSYDWTLDDDLPVFAAAQDLLADHDRLAATNKGLGEENEKAWAQIKETQAKNTQLADKLATAVEALASIAEGQGWLQGCNTAQAALDKIKEP